MEDPDRPGDHACPHTLVTSIPDGIHKHKHTHNVNRWIEAKRSVRGCRGRRRPGRDPDLGMLTAAVVIGIASGGVQTLALTLMARHARTPAQSDRVSAAWNVAFDVGLGTGAFLAVR